MRIVNTGYAPRYLSYGDSTTGGKTLEPGKESRELPLGYMHSNVLWKDIEKGLVQIRLNDEDRAFITKLLAAADKPITLLQPPAPPAPPPPPNPPAPKPTLAPVLDVVKPDVPATAGELAVQDKMKNSGYQPLSKPTGKPSLQDLMNANAGKASLTDIQRHMGSRV